MTATKNYHFKQYDQKAMKFYLKKTLFVLLGCKPTCVPSAGVDLYLVWSHW